MTSSKPPFFPEARFLNLQKRATNIRLAVLLEQLHEILDMGHLTVLRIESILKSNPLLIGNQGLRMITF